jgi:hypothetical protein
MRAKMGHGAGSNSKDFQSTSGPCHRRLPKTMATESAGKVTPEWADHSVAHTLCKEV